MRLMLALILCLLAAKADSISINAGVGEFASLSPPSRDSIYFYAGPGYTHDLGKGFTWTSVLTFEFSPDQLHLGLYAWSTLDVPLSSSLYLNVGINGSQDEYRGDVTHSTFYLGPTIGLTHNLPLNFFIAQSIGFYYGFQDHGLWTYPMITFGKSF